MTQETSRIKIRELEPADGAELRDTDLLAIATENPDETLRANISDVVNAGLSLQAGQHISITKTGNTYTINAASQGFDASALEARIKTLEDQVAALSQGSKVTATQTPPTGANIGDLWWDTNTARMYIYFNSVWVQSNPTGDSPITISTTSKGEPYNDSELRALITGNASMISHLMRRGSGGDTSACYQPGHLVGQYTITYRSGGGGRIERTYADWTDPLVMEYVTDAALNPNLTGPHSRRQVMSSLQPGGWDFGCKGQTTAAAEANGIIKNVPGIGTVHFQASGVPGTGNIIVTEPEECYDYQARMVLSGPTFSDGRQRNESGTPGNWRAPIVGSDSYNLSTSTPGGAYSAPGLLVSVGGGDKMHMFIFAKPLRADSLSPVDVYNQPMGGYYVNSSSAPAGASEQKYGWAFNIGAARPFSGSLDVKVY